MLPSEDAVHEKSIHQQTYRQPHPGQSSPSCYANPLRVTAPAMLCLLCMNVLHWEILLFFFLFHSLHEMVYSDDALAATLVSLAITAS